MTGIIGMIVRQILLDRRMSLVPTGIFPVRRMHRITVLVDSADPEVESLKRDVKAWFSSYEGIDLNIQDAPFSYKLKGYLNLLGLMRRHGYRSVDYGNEDMLICLCKSSQFAFRYAVFTSRAKFKVGREQLQKEPFDLVVCDPEYDDRPQREAFKAIADVLSKIE